MLIDFIFLSYIHVNKIVWCLHMIIMKTCSNCIACSLVWTSLNSLASLFCKQVHMLVDSRTMHLFNVGSAIYFSIRAVDCTPLNFSATVCFNQFHLLSNFFTSSSSLWEHVRLILVFNCTCCLAMGKFVGVCHKSFRFQHCLFSGVNRSHLNALLS